MTVPTCVPSRFRFTFGCLRLRLLLLRLRSPPNANSPDSSALPPDNNKETDLSTEAAHPVDEAPPPPPPPPPANNQEECPPPPANTEEVPKQDIQEPIGVAALPDKSGETLASSDSSTSTDSDEVRARGQRQTALMNQHMNQGGLKTGNDSDESVVITQVVQHQKKPRSPSPDYPEDDSEEDDEGAEGSDNEDSDDHNDSDDDGDDDVKDPDYKGDNVDETEENLEVYEQRPAPSRASVVEHEGDVVHERKIKISVPDQCKKLSPAQVKAKNKEYKRRARKATDEKHISNMNGSSILYVIPLEWELQW